MKLSDIQGQYTVVSNPTKLSDLGGNYSVSNTPGSANEASAALANSTHILNQPQVQDKNAWEKYIADPLQNFSEGAVKGALGTTTGLGQLASKALGLLPGKVGKFFQGAADYGQELQDTALKPEGTAQNVGKGAEQVAEFFIPAGEVGKAEKVLAGGAKTATLEAFIKAGVSPKTAKVLSEAAKLGTKMAVRATEAGAVVGAQTGGNAKEVKAAAIVGGLTPAAGSILKRVVEYIGKGGVLKRLAGALSGRGTAVIDEIIKDPKSAMQGLTGKSIDTLTKDSQTLKEAVIGMKEAAGKEHARVVNNLEEIFQNEGKSFDKGTEINKITDTLESKFGVTKGEEGDLNFNQSRFIDKEGTIINRALNMVKSYDKPLTPKSIDMLASKIEKLKSESPSAVETNNAVHTIINSLRNSVAEMGESVGYKEGANISRNYAIAMDKIDNFNKLFKTSTDDLRASVDQKLPLPEVEKTKIVNDLQTLFSGNKDIDKDVLRNIFGGQEILSREAGRTLVTAPEKASTKIGSLLREAVISPVLSPKKIGQIAAYLSMAKDEVPAFMSKIKKLEPALQGMIIEGLSRKQQDESTTNDPEYSYEEFLKSLDQNQ